MSKEVANENSRNQKAVYQRQAVVLLLLHEFRMENNNKVFWLILVALNPSPGGGEGCGWANFWGKLPPTPLGVNSEAWAYGVLDFDESGGSIFEIFPGFPSLQFRGGVITWASKIGFFTWGMLLGVWGVLIMGVPHQYHPVA